MSREVVTSINDHEYLSLKNSVLMTNFLVKKLVSPSFFFNKEIIQGYGNLHIEKEIDQKYVKNIYVNELKNLTNYLNKINNINKDSKPPENDTATFLYVFEKYKSRLEEISLFFSLIITVLHRNAVRSRDALICYPPLWL